MFSPRILVIDDEEIIRELLQRTLSNDGYAVEVVEDGCLALEQVKRSAFNLLITDLKMPKVDGMTVLREMKKVNPYIEVIVITGYPTIESSVEAIKIGAFDFICKPFDIGEMRASVLRCLEKQKFAINRIELSELTAFFEISKTIAVSTNLDSLLERILDFALGVVNAQRGSFLLRDDKINALQLKVTRGNSDQAAAQMATRFNEGAYSALTEERTLPFVNIEEKNGKSNSSRGDAEREAFLSIPLVSRYFNSQGEVLGVINISDKISGENFTEREQTLLSVLAGQAVAAIENYRLFHQLQDKIKALEDTIDNLEATQNQLIQSEKMAGVGQLAFGIAHEIRNPLGIILGGVEFVKSNIVSKNIDEITVECLEKIRLSIERANNIIVDLLKFSRASKLELTSIDACQLLDEAAALIKNQAYLSNIEIRRDYQSDIYIEADATMLRQAFFNLCANGIDAMPKGGELFLRVYSGQRKEDDKQNVIVEIEDTGKGIPQNIISKIFDPFFTTKEPGKGTGLGLSIVHLILERHRATITVESQENKGTKFIIRLPALLA